MAGDQHCSAVVGKLAEQVAQPAHTLGVKAAERFVQNEGCGISEQGSGSTPAGLWAFTLQPTLQ